MADKADAIGNIFFNLLSLDCIQPQYPLICMERDHFAQIVVGRTPECRNWHIDLDSPPLAVHFMSPKKPF